MLLTGGPGGNGGSQHDRKCGGSGGGGGGGGPLNFRPDCNKYFIGRITDFNMKTGKKDLMSKKLR